MKAFLSHFLALTLCVSTASTAFATFAAPSLLGPAPKHNPAVIGFDALPERSILKVSQGTYNLPPQKTTEAVQFASEVLRGSGFNNFLHEKREAGGQHSYETHFSLGYQDSGFSGAYYHLLGNGSGTKDYANGLGFIWQWSRALYFGGLMEVAGNRTETSALSMAFLVDRFLKMEYALINIDDQATTVTQENHGIFELQLGRMVLGWASGYGIATSLNHPAERTRTYLAFQSEMSDLSFAFTKVESTADATFLGANEFTIGWSF